MYMTLYHKGNFLYVPRSWNMTMNGTQPLIATSQGKLAKHTTTRGKLQCFSPPENSSPEECWHKTYHKNPWGCGKRQAQRQLCQNASQDNHGPYLPLPNPSIKWLTATFEVDTELSRKSFAPYKGIGCGLIVISQLLYHSINGEVFSKNIDN